MQSTEQILASTPGSSQLPTSSQTPSRVLVVEPHPTLRTVLVQRLRQDGHLAAAVGTAARRRPTRGTWTRRRAGRAARRGAARGWRGRGRRSRSRAVQ